MSIKNLTGDSTKAGDAYSTGTLGHICFCRGPSCSFALIISLEFILLLLFFLLDVCAATFLSLWFF